MDVQELANTLYEARRMRTPDEVQSFERAREALAASKNPAVIAHLLAALDDSTEHEEVMWGLVHDAEAFEREAYVNALVSSMSQMLPHAKDWAILLHMRILNSDDAVELYRKVLPTVPEETQRSIREILEEIQRTRPKYSKQIRALLKQKRPA